LLVFVFGEEAKKEFALVGLAGGDHEAAVAVERGVITLVEPKFAFAVIGVLAVAVKTIFRKDRPDIAVEL
jgi:hypothetical protein